MCVVTYNLVDKYKVEMIIGPIGYVFDKLTIMDLQ